MVLSVEDLLEWFFGNNKENVFEGVVIHFTGLDKAMKKIYKYAIEITDDQDIVMPVGAESLTYRIRTEFLVYGLW